VPLEACQYRMSKTTFIYLKCKSIYRVLFLSTQFHSSFTNQAFRQTYLVIIPKNCPFISASIFIHVAIGRPESGIFPVYSAIKATVSYNPCDKVETSAQISLKYSCFDQYSRRSGQIARIGTRYYFDIGDSGQVEVTLLA